VAALRKLLLIPRVREELRRGGEEALTLARGHGLNKGKSFFLCVAEGGKKISPNKLGGKEKEWRRPHTLRDGTVGGGSAF